MAMRKSTIEAIRKACLFVYDSFAADTNDVAEHMGLTVQSAYGLLSKCDLMTADIIDDGISGDGINSRTRPGLAATWQCWKTYDSINREEAIAIFDKWVADSTPKMKIGGVI